MSNLKVSCLKKDLGCDWAGSIENYFEVTQQVNNVRTTLYGGVITTSKRQNDVVITSF